MGSYLLLDTSQPIVEMGIVEGEKLTVLQGSSRESCLEELPYLFQEVIKQSGVSLSSLTQIVLGSGPGSFTGLRIGFSFVQGVAQSLDLPVEVLPSLQCVSALLSRERKTPCYAVSDARRGEMFCSYDGQETSLVPLSELVEISLKAPIMVFGESELRGETLLVPPPEMLISGLFYGLEAGFAKTFSAGNLHLLEPLYVRQVLAKTIAERSSP